MLTDRTHRMPVENQVQMPEMPNVKHRALATPSRHVSR